MTRALDPKKIKSAQRVLEVLEYFNKDRPEGTVMDIARTFNYPQSSTSELLSCLVALGYLRRDLRARTYKPSARVAVLGSWIRPDLFRYGEVLPMMDALAEEARANVFLSSRVGLAVQIFHSANMDTDGGFDPGDSLRLLSTAPGKVLLTTTDREQVRKLAHRINAESAEHLRVRADDLLAELDQIRSQGYSLHTEDGRSMISVLVPQALSAEPLVLTLEAAEAEVSHDLENLVRRLRAAVSRHVGLVDVSGQTARRAPAATATAYSVAC